VLLQQELQELQTRARERKRLVFKESIRHLAFASTAAVRRTVLAPNVPLLFARFSIPLLDILAPPRFALHLHKELAAVFWIHFLHKGLHKEPAAFWILCLLFLHKELMDLNLLLSQLPPVTTILFPLLLLEL
jgi:hypothetical protein